MDEQTTDLGDTNPRKKKDEPTVLEKIDKGLLPLLSLRLSRTYEFDAVGKGAERKPVLRVKESPILPVSNWNAKMDLVEQSRPIKLSSKHQIDLPPGITIILGKSGAGKTRLALNRMSALNDNVLYVRYGEPLDAAFIAELRAKHVKTIPHEVALAKEMATFLFSTDSDVLIVDSFRPLVYATGGATGKGGVNMTLFAELSFLDVAVAATNKSVVVLINPLTDDQASYDQLKEVAAGSVSALIDVRAHDSIAYNSRFELRKWVDMRLPASTPLDEVVEQTMGGSNNRDSSLKYLTK